MFCFFLIVRNNLQPQKSQETLREGRSSAPFRLAVVPCFMSDGWFALSVPPKQLLVISLQ